MYNSGHKAGAYVLKEGVSSYIFGISCILCPSDIFQAEHQPWSP